MAEKRKTECTVCGVAASEETPISRRGKCPRCGERAQVDSVRQMHEREGPVFDRWRRRMAQSVGAQPPPTSPSGKQ